jgi:hypothetical protein
VDERVEVVGELVGRTAHSPQRNDLCYVNVTLSPASPLVGHGDVTCVSLSVLIERLSHTTDTIS